jgi:hypothetical protein
MVLPRQSSKLLRFFLPLLLVIWIATYLLPASQSTSLLDSCLFRDGKKHAPTMEEFIRQEMNHEIDGPYNLEPLTKLCRTRDCHLGLIVKCLATPGGMGNVRNMILNCIRFTLEGGGSIPVCINGTFTNLVQ